MSDRYCPTCNTIKPVSRFMVKHNGKPARDCMGCEHERKIRKHARPAPVRFDGVDIDRIHYVRGAVRKPA